MTPYILIITLIAHGQTGAIEIKAGILATPELCAMAGRGIVTDIDQPNVAEGFRCVPMGDEV